MQTRACANSRGRQLEPNETLKAKFLSIVESKEEKLDWGTKWESWQDFFWKQRDSTNNETDADPGFNEFLRMVQLITMCKQDKTALEITIFANNKSNKSIDLQLLPSNLVEIESYFHAYKWLVESKKINDFVNKYESSNFLIATDRKLISYFRILPLVVLLSHTTLIDENVIVRFMRFFYNLSRKSNLSKDITNQIPAAINLMIEYSGSKFENFDVCDLRDYQQKRTVLISKEEMIKLNLYSSPPTFTTREEIEKLFWDNEDHPIFSGEIEFLLTSYWDQETQSINLNSYRKSWSAFKCLFPGKGDENNSMLIRALLYYGYTWTQNSPYYYNNYHCSNWNKIVQHETHRIPLLALLEDMHDRQKDYIDTLIKRNIKKYFIENKLISIESLKSVSNLFPQVKVLTALDYFSKKEIWSKHCYLAEETRWPSSVYGDSPFFYTDRPIYNINRYIGDGLNGRVLYIMKETLQNPESLNQIITDILAWNSHTKCEPTNPGEIIAE